MMESQNTSKSSSTLSFSEKIIIYTQFEVHLVYLLILWILGKDAIFASEITPTLFFLLYSFIIISILSVVITYRYAIPWMLKKKNANEEFSIILTVFIVGTEVPSILGLLFGIIGILGFNTIYWQICFPLILFGFGHSLYLYFFKIKPYLRPTEEV